MNFKYTNVQFLCSREVFVNKCRKKLFGNHAHSELDKEILHWLVMLLSHVQIMILIHGFCVTNNNQILFFLEQEEKMVYIAMMFTHQHLFSLSLD